MHKLRINILYFIFLVAASCVTTSAQECVLERVSIAPLATSNNTVFVGKMHSVEVRFRNESDNKEVEVFPEPPLLVTNLRTKKQCSLDGGIWVRDGVYLSANEQLLVTHEYSGSNDFLNLYDLNTCQKINEIDISEKNFSIQGNTVLIGAECGDSAMASCKTRKQIKLDQNCKIEK